MNLKQDHQKIISAIESYVEDGADYLDAVITYCQKNNMEIEVVAHIVKKSTVFKQKLKEELIRKNMVKDNDEKTTRFQDINE